MMEELSRKLDFPYKRNGSLVLCFDEKDRPRLEKLLQQGKENGVEGEVFALRRLLISFRLVNIELFDSMIL